MLLNSIKEGKSPGDIRISGAGEIFQGTDFIKRKGRRRKARAENHDTILIFLQTNTGAGNSVISMSDSVYQCFPQSFIRIFVNLNA